MGNPGSEDSRIDELRGLLNDTDNRTNLERTETARTIYDFVQAVRDGDAEVEGDPTGTALVQIYGRSLFSEGGEVGQNNYRRVEELIAGNEGETLFQVTVYPVEQGGSSYRSWVALWQIQAGIIDSDQLVFEPDSQSYGKLGVQVRNHVSYDGLPGFLATEKPAGDLTLVADDAMSLLTLNGTALDCPHSGRVIETTGDVFRDYTDDIEDVYINYRKFADEDTRPSTLILVGGDEFFAWLNSQHEHMIPGGYDAEDSAILVGIQDMLVRAGIPPLTIPEGTLHTEKREAALNDHILEMSGVVNGAN